MSNASRHQSCGTSAHPFTLTAHPRVLGFGGARASIDPTRQRKAILAHIAEDRAVVP